MYITIEELLNSGFFQNYELVAGEENLDNEITAVEILEAPDSTDFVMRGTFLLTTGYSIKDDSDMYSDILEKAVTRGVSVIGLKPRFWDKQNLAMFADAAVKVKIPVILIHDEYSYKQMTDFIRDNIFCHISQSLVREEELTRRCLEAVKCGEAGAFERIIREFTGYDAKLSFFYECSQESLELVNLADRRVHAYHDFHNTGKVVWEYLLQDRDPKCLLLAEVQCDNRIVGRLYIESEQFSFRQRDAFVLSTVADYAKNFYQERKKDYQDLVRELSELVSSYRDGTSSLEKIYQALGKTSGPDEVPSRLMLLETEKKRKIEWVCDMVHEIQKEAGESCMLFFQKDHLFCIMPETVEGDMFASNLLEDDSFCLTSIVISGPGNIAEISQLIDECLRFREVRNKLFPDLKIINQRKLGFWELIDARVPESRLLDYCRRYIEPLIEYEEKHDAALMETLRGYIECGFNMGDAASKMFIHVNTVRYRLNSIEKLMGEDFLERNNPFEIYLAIAIFNKLRNEKPDSGG